MRIKHVLLIGTVLLMVSVSGCKPPKGTNLNDKITWTTLSDSLSYSDPDLSIQEDSLSLGGPSFSTRVSLLIPGTKDRELAGVVDSIRRQIIYRMIDVNAENMTPEDAISRHIKTLLEEHKAGLEEAKEMTSHEHDAMDSSLFLFVMQHTTMDSLAFNQDNIISLLTVLDEYTGGAHGLNSMSSLNYDLEQNKRITFSMLFTQGAEEAINQMIQEELMRQFKVTAPEDLESEGIYNYENAKVTENFYLSDKGVTFYFNPYEIGAYFLGTIKITIPYTDLHSLLQDNYRKIDKQ